MAEEQISELLSVLTFVQTAEREAAECGRQQVITHHQYSERPLQPLLSQQKTEELPATPPRLLSSDFLENAEQNKILDHVRCR